MVQPDRPWPKPFGDYPQYIIDYLQSNNKDKLTSEEEYWYNWICRIENRIEQGFSINDEEKLALNNCRARFDLPPIDIRLYKHTQEEIDLEDAIRELDKEFPTFVPD